MTKSEKQRHILKLMVIALNEVITLGVINLDGKSAEMTDEEKSGYAEISIGGRPSIINWYDAGYDELRVSVWWDYQPECMPTWRKNHINKWLVGLVPETSRSYFRHILGACGSCYLERQTGKFIVGEEGNQFFSVYVREDTTQHLTRIEAVQPLGYLTSGHIPV